MIRSRFGLIVSLSTALAGFSSQAGLELLVQGAPGHAGTAARGPSASESCPPPRVFFELDDDECPALELVGKKAYELGEQVTA